MIAILMIKRILKKVRFAQSVNHLATSVLRGLFNITGKQSEFVIKHLPRVGITTIPLPGGQLLKFDASGEDWIPTQLYWRGWQGYEPEMTPLFYRLAREAQTVFDVGAYIGFYTLLAAISNPDAQVFAFEPLARVYKRLEQNVALNALANVRCFCAAAGERSGVQEFYFPDHDAPVVSSLRSEMILATLPADTIRHVPVPVVTLDQIVEQYKVARVDLIKLDTERTEHEVLAGCRETLARDRPEVICEVWPDAGNKAQLESILRPLGYRFYQLFPDRVAAREEIIGDELALNYLFTVRPDKIGC